MSDEPIDMYWWDDAKHGRNFGDAASPKIVKALSGCTIRKAKEPGDTRLLACGSILKWARKGDRIWGAGQANVAHETNPGIEVHAVRGPLTRASLQAQGIRCPDVYGDPGLLLPLLYGPRRPERHYRIGIVPHYVDHEHAKMLLQGKLKDSDALLIDVMSGPAKVIDAICSCDWIASSSLHGLVAAEAYGVPALWVEFSDKVSGNGMKFRDYYLSLRDDFCSPVNWRSKVELAQVEPESSLPEVERLIEVQHGLLESAPFELRQEITPAHVREDEGWAWQ